MIQSEYADTPVLIVSVVLGDSSDYSATDSLDLPGELEQVVVNRPYFDFLFLIVE